MTEAQLQYKLAERLGEYFNVQREVCCSNGRIDLVLKCKKTKAVMGLEVKKVDKKRGRDLGMFLKQASRYSEANFVNHSGCIPVFIYPAISYNYLICPEDMVVVGGDEYFKDRHQKGSVHHTMQGFIGAAFNVGELRVFPYKGKNYIRFVFNNDLIWTNQPQYQSSEIIGLHEVNYEKLIKRINGNNI